VSRARLEISEDAGGYYCEHVLFLAKKTLRAQNPSARAMFLHVVKDAFSTTTQKAPESRFDDIDAIVSRVLHRFASEGARKIVLTGFEPFGDVLQNPSGDYLSSQAFINTSNLLRKRYNIALKSFVLSVDDRAIDGTEHSIQCLIKTEKPDILLSLGVANQRFFAECIATDRNLKHGNGTAFHVKSLDARTKMERDTTLFKAWDFETLV